MKDRDQSKSPSDTGSKHEPARRELPSQKRDEQSDHEGQANADGSTASRPRGQTEDPDKTL